MEPDISSDEIAHLEQLIVTLRRRQRVLETQRAKFDGAALPSHIVLELEDLTRDLAQHTADLRRLRPRAIAEQNPYLGLLTFQEADADRFFGRDALIADLIDRAGRAPFLAVLGASGSGKSSVARAGLVPMLKGGALPGSERWRYVTLRPGARPLDALAVELAKLQGGDLGAALTLTQQLASSDRALLVAAGMLLDRAASQRLVLVVDQAEELWTLAPTAPEAQTAFVAEQQRPFIQLLLTASGAPDAPLLIVLTMRADFLHRAAEQPTFAHAIAEHDVIVSPMSAAELHDAILRPAELAGGSFEPGLVDELVEQTLGRAGALPLLEYTLQELWKRRANDGAMAWESYRALGGIEGALAARADAILAERYTPAQQDELRRLLLRLVQPGEGAADTRRRAALDDLVPAGASLEAVQALLQPLTDERLLVVTGTNEQHPTTEPTVGGAASSFVLRPSSSFVLRPSSSSPTRRSSAPGRPSGAGSPRRAPICASSSSWRMPRRSGRPARRTPICSGAGCAWPRPRPGSCAPRRGSTPATRPSSTPAARRPRWHDSAPVGRPSGSAGWRSVWPARSWSRC